MAQSAPDWMMLDRFVYRRDDEKDFPDKSSAPFRADSCTSLGQTFEVAFLPANPPAISRFYVRWPGGTKPEEGGGVDIVEAHLDLLLFRLTSIEKLEEYPHLNYIQDHFVCIASSEPEPHLQLKRLPSCTIPVTIPPREGEEENTVLPRAFFPNTVGLMRYLNFKVKGSIKEVFVAQLANVCQMPESTKMEAEVCLFHSGAISNDVDGKWEVKKIPIQHKDDEYKDIWYWSTDAVLTFDLCICWVDYYRGGMLIYDVLGEQPTISYRRLKINNRPTNSSVCQTLPDMNRSLCVTSKMGMCTKSYMPLDMLRFVDVIRSDKYIFGPFDLGYGFTISISTLGSLRSVDDAWVENFSITSEELWALNTSSDLPHEMLMFPVVSMENPSIVYFLVSQFVEEEEIKKVSLATIDIIKKEVLSVVPYISEGEDIDMIKEKTRLLKGFVTSTFPVFFKPGSGGKLPMMEESKVEEKKPKAKKDKGGRSGAK